MSADLLDMPVVLSIFERLDIPELLVLREVSKEWKKSSEEVIHHKFKSFWGLAEVQGLPFKYSFYKRAALSSFVHQHVRTGADTLLSIALKHGVTPMALRVANNLMSDHSLRSRSTLYIPVTSVEQFKGRKARFVFCKVTLRQLVVLLDEAAEESLLEEMGTAPSVAELSQRFSQALGQVLKIDEATARYYLGDAQGDLKAAIRLYERDSQWERESSGSAVRQRSGCQEANVHDSW